MRHNQILGEMLDFKKILMPLKISLSSRLILYKNKSTKFKKSQNKENTLDDNVSKILNLLEMIHQEIRPENYKAEPKNIYPKDDRFQLYIFLKPRVTLPTFKTASFPSLFHASARFFQKLNPNLTKDQALVYVARSLIDERPLRNLLYVLKSYENDFKKLN